MTDEAQQELSAPAREAVAAYCSGLGLQDADFNGQGRLDLVIDDRPISFCIAHHTTPALWIGCEISAVEPDDREALTWLLNACMEPWLLRGARVGLLPNTTTAAVYKVFPCEQITEETLAQIADALLETAASLAARLAKRDFMQSLH